jgi:hypothetical protein
MSAFNSIAKMLVASIVTGLAHTAMTEDVQAQEKPAPPDLSSNQTGWLTFETDFKAIPGGRSPVWNDPAHPHVSNPEAARTGKQPSYFIADLDNPNLKPWVKERMKKDNEEVLAGKIAFTAHSSCTPAGVPGFHLYGFQPIYFIQTPKEVVMIFSGDAQVRRVYLDAPHSENPKPSWYGESVGHYEGDTLGLSDKTFIDNFRTPHTGKLHVVERLALVDGGKALEVNVRVEDADAFYEPWSGLQRYDRIQRPMSEDICAEGNRHLFDYHMPVAEKPDF